MANPISSSGVVNGQIVYAQQVLEISRALNGTGSNSIIILGDVKQGSLSNSTDNASSFAHGSGSNASGLFSHVEGETTQATGNYSHAEGYDATSQGTYSHAEGNASISVGNYSHAEGKNTNSTGQYSHAEGESTQAIGNASHAEGYYTISNQNYSHAEGYYTKTIGTASHAEGYNTTSSGNYSHAEGTASISSGSYSHAEGELTIAFGNSSHAEGKWSWTKGIYSHAEGFSTETRGDASHTEGFYTIASGAYSHTEGNSTYTLGSYSHAEGHNTIAQGENSHAEGESTVAIGNASHAEGLYTIASASYQSVVGQYNAQNNTTDYFVVGVGGSSNTRADGLGVNATRTYISNSVYLPNLTNTGQTNIVTFNSTGQLFYAASESIKVTSASYALSSSYTLSSSYALTASYSPGAGAVGSSLTQGTGVTVFSYNGSSAQTVAVSGASALSSNNITKWTGTAFANSSLTDNGTTITGVSSIQLTGASSNLSGSFSGSFQGDGTNLTGVTATPVFPPTAITNIASSDKVFVNDGANKHITYLNLLTDLAGTNLSVESSDSLTLASTITDITSISATSFTGSYTGSFTGPLTGTASYVTGALFTSTNPVLSASYALTASYSPGAGAVGSSLTQGTGITTFSYNGGSAQTVAVSGAANLTTNLISKWTGTAFANSSLTDSGTTITGTTSIQLSGVNSSLTGSFTGSFNGVVPTLKAGAVAAGSFTSIGGDNYKATVTFGTTYPNTNYSISIVGLDARSWTIESKGSGQFTINSNSTTVLSGEVYWITTPYNN